MNFFIIFAIHNKRTECNVFDYEGNTNKTQ